MATTRAYFLRAGLLSCALTALVTAALLLGRGLPPSPLIQYWHLTDCAPSCWLGIVPGETSWYDANRRLRENLGMTYTYPLVSFSRADLYARLPLHSDPLPLAEVPARFYLEEEVVTGITVPYGPASSHDFAMPRIGDIVTTFGTPTCVDPWYVDPWSPKFQGWSLYYDTPSRITRVAVSGGDSLSWTQPIDSMTFGEYMAGSGLGWCFSGAGMFQPWRGLHRARYQRGE